MQCRATHGLLLAFIFALYGCQTKPVERDDRLFIPYVGGAPEVIASTPLMELRKLQLVSTNLVSAMVQIPEMKIGTATLQVSNPTTAFGNTLIRALEDAGFGLQRVTADQGMNYVTYGNRFSETDSGPVTDFSVAVGEIEVRREFDVSKSNIYPTSLLVVSGTNSIVDIVVDDDIFIEQGGTGDSFISGVSGSDLSSPITDTSSVTVNAYDATPRDKRSEQRKVLAEARQRAYTKESESRPKNLSNLAKLRRTVLIFDDKDSMIMGRGNKKVIGRLADRFTQGDVFAITACADVDGKNEAAQYRAVRVEEEFVSNGIVPSSVQIQPCSRASYRHSSDDSPVAVSVVQYRNR